MVNSTNLIAQVNYPSLNIDEYKIVEYSKRTYGNTTKWELERLETINAFLNELFAVPGFCEFFVDNNCCVKKRIIKDFLNKKGCSLEFPTVLEYESLFSWLYQPEVGSALGYVIDRNDWLYDSLAIPDITVTVGESVIRPFREDEDSCIALFAEDDSFAWDLCENSAYLVPYLYNLARRCDFNIEFLWEGGFDRYFDCALLPVLQYLDEAIPFNNVVLQEDTALAGAGEYKMHIIDRGNVREIIRVHKDEIRRIIQAVKLKEEIK